MVSLDDMLPPDEGAAWMKMPRRELMAKSRGRRASIPVLKVGPQTLRFCPRIIIAKMAKDAGVPMEVIAASFGMKLEAVR